MAAGINMDPGGLFSEQATTLGAVSAFPYSGEDKLVSIGSVLSQVAFGPNDSTQAVIRALHDALAGSSGTLDIIAYSGGAQAFNTAMSDPSFTATDIARIGTVLYIAPGGSGPLWTTGNPANTTVLTGPGWENQGAGFDVAITAGTNRINTTCSHTDYACWFAAAASQLSAMAGHGPCGNRDTFLRGGERLIPSGVTGGAIGGRIDNYSGGWMYWSPVYVGL